MTAVCSVQLRLELNDPVGSFHPRNERPLWGRSILGLKDPLWVA